MKPSPITPKPPIESTPSRGADARDAERVRTRAQEIASEQENAQREVAALIAARDAEAERDLSMARAVEDLARRQEAENRDRLFRLVLRDAVIGFATFVLTSLFFPGRPR